MNHMAAVAKTELDDVAFCATVMKEVYQGEWKGVCFHSPWSDQELDPGLDSPRHMRLRLL